jgi:GNAT superfamily N-acetyltransferase
MQTGHTLTVRRAVATDRAGLAALLSDMQAHYGLPDPPGGAAEMARLLTRNGALLGLASLSPVLFSGAFQWMLFLKDLYVTGAARSLGVGRALLVAAARTALEEDYCRIDWTTDATNDGAQRLYDGLGVPRHDKRFYRLSGDDLKKFAHG